MTGREISSQTSSRQISGIIEVLFRLDKETGCRQGQNHNRVSEHELGLNFRGRLRCCCVTVITCKSSSGRKTSRSTTTRNCSSAKRIVELLAFTTCSIIWKTDHHKLWARASQRGDSPNLQTCWHSLACQTVRGRWEGGWRGRGQGEGACYRVRTWWWSGGYWCSHRHQDQTKAPTGCWLPGGVRYWLMLYTNN